MPTYAQSVASTFRENPCIMRKIHTSLIAIPLVKGYEQLTPHSSLIVWKVNRVPFVSMTTPHAGAHCPFPFVSVGESLQEKGCEDSE